MFVFSGGLRLSPPLTCAFLCFRLTCCYSVLLFFFFFLDQLFNLFWPYLPQILLIYSYLLYTFVIFEYVF